MHSSARTWVCRRSLDRRRAESRGLQGPRTPNPASAQKRRCRLTPRVRYRVSEGRPLPSRHPFSRVPEFILGTTLTPS